MWAKPLLMKNSIKELVDPTLGDAYDSEQMDHVACAACICIDQSPSERPQMSQGVRVLEEDESSLIELKLRQRSRHQRAPSVADLFDADEYNPTEYLSHLNQQMVVLVNCNEKSEDHDRSTTDRNQQKGGGGSRPHRN